MSCNPFRSIFQTYELYWCYILGRKTKFIMPILFESCCNRSVFESWLTSFGQSLGESKPMKDRIIILDNATFHKGEEIENYDALVLGFKSM